MNKVQFSLESFKNIQDLIKFTDQKTGAVLVLSGVLLTALFRVLRELVFIPPLQATFIEIITFIFGLMTFTSLFIIVYISINKILKPRLAKNYNSDDSSIFYFEHLSKLGKENIYLKYAELKEDDMIRFIVDQQYEISKILELKIKFLNIAFMFLFLSVAFLSIFLILLGIK